MSSWSLTRNVVGLTERHKEYVTVLPRLRNAFPRKRRINAAFPALAPRRCASRADCQTARRRRYTVEIQAVNR